MSLIVTCETPRCQPRQPLYKSLQQRESQTSHVWLISYTYFEADFYSQESYSKLCPFIMYK